MISCVVVKELVIVYMAKGVGAPLLVPDLAAICTRPDIYSAVGALSSLMSNPNENIPCK